MGVVEGEELVVGVEVVEGEELVEGVEVVEWVELVELVESATNDWPGYGDY